MLGRLLIGIVKGLVVGGLLGFGLVKLGMALPGALIAYLAAAVTGVVIGLVAGKPIWAKDAKIEAGAKAIVGALLGVGLMAAARHWLTMALPIPAGNLAPEGATFGGFAITSLAAIAALLGGFYDADNDATDEEAAPAGAEKAQAQNGGRRIASQDEGAEEDEELLESSEKKRAKK
ncbi:Hypothetical protein A7982_09049 [Minicystis rosea]|nr:Hypothetical protein A7982_09049 [Minicystis rosea]